MAHIEMSFQEFFAYAESKGIVINKITPTRVFLDFEIDHKVLDRMKDPHGVLHGNPLYGYQKDGDGITLRAHLDSGKKIHAIKAVRFITRLGLKEAKDIVDANS